ncbi:uncharacterized protein LOC108142025 [Drosophila elegans]|uniref:uncharacterized protein LOC108142025 n=1 Tax=Drosophila elegans TaxID=30023 RepID=UPI0007E84A2A|nr:uncharacterized protein LOC108142025 [Drosophila elegans]
MITKRNFGSPFSYHTYFNSRNMKGFKRRKTKDRQLQQILHKLLKRESSSMKRLPKMSLHQSRFMLAECIKLLQQQNRELHENYLQEERNNRRLSIISRKLRRHRAHSILLKNAFNNLKSSLNEHGCNENPTIKSQLKEVRMLTKGNIKEVEDCIRVTKGIIVNKMGILKRKTRRSKKNYFDRTIDQFYNKLKIQRKIKSKININDVTKKPKGPYEVPSVQAQNRGLETEKFNEKSGERQVIGGIVSAWSNDSKNFKGSSSGYIVFQTTSISKEFKDILEKNTERKLSLHEEESFERKIKGIPHNDPKKPELNEYNEIETGTKLKNKRKNPESVMSLKREQKLHGNVQENLSIEPQELTNTEIKTDKSGTARKIEKPTDPIARSKRKVSKVKMWLGSYKGPKRRSKSSKDAVLRNVHFKNRSASYPNSFNRSTFSNSLTGLKPHPIIENKAKSDKNITQSNMMLQPKPFKIASNFNPVKTKFWDSQRNRPPLSKFNNTSSIYRNPSIKSMENVARNFNQSTMSQVASAIVDRLHDAKQITLDETRFHKQIHIRRMSLNSFLGKISKIKPGDQMNAVWHDLQEKHKVWSANAKTPEDVQKIKKILKLRYIHNVQKLLHNHIKQLKNDLDGGRFSRGARTSYMPTHSYDSLGLHKKTSKTDTIPNKNVHENFIRLQMEILRSRIFDRDVIRMERMLMAREVPLTETDFEIFERYKYDPDHYNILILSIGRPISDEKYEEKLPILERNFEFICNQLEIISRQRRLENMQTKHGLQKAEEEIVSKFSGESFIVDRIDFNETFLAKRREVWAAYIAKQAKTPTEILLEAIRKQKRKAQLAKKAEEREKRHKQVQQMPKRKRSLSAMYRAPRKTHRERLATQNIQMEMEEAEELAGRQSKSRCPATSLCCRRCSRCGLIWTRRCSEVSTEESVEHICPVNP